MKPREASLAVRLWRDVPAAAYDGHMGHPAVDQSRLLADLLDELVGRLRPTRLLIPGVATGNGLERLRGRPLARATRSR